MFVKATAHVYLINMSEIGDFLKKRPEFVFFGTFLSLGALSLGGYGLQKSLDQAEQYSAMTTIKLASDEVCTEQIGPGPTDWLFLDEWGNKLRPNRSFFKLRLIPPQSDGDSCVADGSVTTFTESNKDHISVDKIYCNGHSVEEILNSKEIVSDIGDVSNPSGGPSMCADGNMKANDNWLGFRDTVFDMYFDAKY
jgi:hypothetical protein